MTPFSPTPEQAKIIGHGPESLRISAGAGTGKTTTIVQRLASMVEQGGDPARALGITFTNKAAGELRDRLRAVTGHTDGKEVEVATYHSFAASLLDEFGARMGTRVSGVLMDDGHRFELAARVLRSLPDTSLDLTKLPSLRKDVLMVSDALNDNLLDAATVRAAAPAAPDTTWDTRLALLDAAEAFREAKARLGLIEYSDLIRRAVELVERHPDVAAEVASRYDTVLLDEYQDTDRAQRALLRTLFAGRVPVTAVGDTDQTIYEWRGASIQNFEGFPSDFPAAEGAPSPTLPLSVNRRSDRRILDLANAIRTEIPTTDGAEPLTPRDGAGEGDVVTAWFATEREEAAWIASEMAHRHDEGRPYTDMAVLCRRRDSFKVIAEELRRAGIPFVVSSTSDLLQIPEVADLVAWLRLLAHPTDEPSLLRIIMGGRYRLGMADVAALAGRVGRREGTGLLGAALDPGSLDALAPASADALASFAATYDRLFEASQAASVTSTIDATLTALDYWAEVAALPAHRSTTARLNVSRLVDLADRWHPLDGVPTLQGFLRYLDALAEPGRAEELDSVELPTSDAVMLLTAHGAKGLEWSDVYLPDVARTVFPGTAHAYYDPSTSPQALPYALRLDAEAMADVDALDDPADRKDLLRKRHRNQEWRLAYVAVTRARHRLVISGHAWHKDNTKARVPSELLEMARRIPGATSGPYAEDPGPKPQYEAHVPVPPPTDPLFPTGWADALRAAAEDEGWIATQYPDLAQAATERSEQLHLELASLREPSTDERRDRFSTSVTSLVALAECPLKFAWIHHDRLPRRPRRSAKLGTELHRRIELHNLGVIPLDHAEDAEYDDDGESGDGDPRPRTDPWRSFASSRFHEASPILVETPFEITLDGRSLRGKVDAVYGDDDRWEIVDYKSGVPGASDARRVQLQAYALAGAAGALGRDMPDDVDVTFAYFGTSPATEITEGVDTAWLDEASTTIGGLLAQAQEGPFPADPSPACRWCDFLHHCAEGTRHVGS